MDFFDAAYQAQPPWDIGRPQPEIVDLARAGCIAGSVLDVGCGTGENALYLAHSGREVWGIDAAPTAIEKARSKAGERGVACTFVVGNALDLSALGRTFDTEVDVGLFHVFADEQRRVYVASLAAALRPGGKYYMLCFSEDEPGTWGPRRVRQDEIRAAFNSGWNVDYIRSATFETTTAKVRAWLSSITRN